MVVVFVIVIIIIVVGAVVVGAFVGSCALVLLLLLLLILFLLFLLLLLLALVLLLLLLLFFAPRYLRYYYYCCCCWLHHVSGLADIAGIRNTKEGMNGDKVLTDTSQGHRHLCHSLMSIRPTTKRILYKPHAKKFTEVSSTRKTCFSLCGESIKKRQAFALD